MKIVKKFMFNSAHYLPNYVGKCKQLHGHTYFLEVAINGNINPDTGMITDFEEIQRLVTNKALIYLDHKCLNDVIKNPTAENVIVWIKNKLVDCFSGVITLRLWETPDSYVEL